MSFDRVAPWYRALETIAFGRDLQRCRVAFLTEIASLRRALIVGEGNGRFLCELLRAHREVEVDCVDASARMLRLAQERVERDAANHSVHFYQRDVLSWTPPEAEYDLIVTHFFLDCFPEKQIADIVRKLARAAANNATWLLADFRIPVNGFARIRAQIWLRLMYGFFRYAAGIEADKLINPSPFLRAAGFLLTRQHLFRSGLLASELWQRH